MTPVGSIRRIGEDEPRLLHAAQVSVGTLGVMTELELEVAEAYRLSEQVDVWPWQEVMDRWDELVHDHRHFGFFWMPSEESAASTRWSMTPTSTSWSTSWRWSAVPRR